jgi:hypothetical protein
MGSNYDIKWALKHFQMEYLPRSNQGAHKKAASLVKSKVGDMVKIELMWRYKEIFKLCKWELTGWMKSGTITDDITRPDENATSYQLKYTVVDKVQSSNKNLYISSVTAYQPDKEMMLKNILLESSIQELAKEEEGSL